MTISSARCSPATSTIARAGGAARKTASASIPSACNARTRSVSSRSTEQGPALPWCTFACTRTSCPRHKWATFRANGRARAERSELSRATTSVCDMGSSFSWVQRAASCYSRDVSVHHQVAYHHGRMDVALVEVTAGLRRCRELDGLHVAGASLDRRLGERGCASVGTVEQMPVVLNGGLICVLQRYLRAGLGGQRGCIEAQRIVGWSANRQLAGTRRGCCTTGLVRRRSRLGRGRRGCADS